MSVYEVTVRGQMLGKDLLNMYYFHHPAMTPEIFDFTIGSLFAGLLELADWQSDDYTAGGYVAKRVDIGGQPAIASPFDTLIQGVKPDDILPPQISMLMLTYAETTAPNKGRKYFGGFAEGATSANNFVNSAVTAASDLAQFLITRGYTAGGDGADWVIPHWVGPTEEDPEVLWHVETHNPITTVRVIRETRTHRSRTQGRGS